MPIIESLVWLKPSWSPLHICGWALTRPLPGILCCRDPAALDLRVSSLHVLQQTIDGVDVAAGQVITLSLGLGICRVGLPDGKRGQLSYDHNFGTRKPIPSLTVLALLCCLGKVKGLVSWMLQLLGDRNGTPTLMATGTVLPLAFNIDGWERGLEDNSHPFISP